MIVGIISNNTRARVYVISKYVQVFLPIDTNYDKNVLIYTRIQTWLNLIINISRFLTKELIICSS